MQPACILAFGLIVLANLAAVPVPPAEKQPPITTIVFVCHVVDGKTLPVVTRELNKAISGLKDPQRFDIVIVTDKGQAAGFAKGGVPVPATLENKKASVAFVGAIRPTKSDNPLPALTTVLARKNDLVYLLTDAATLHKDVSGASVTAVNKGKTKINTLLFETFTKPVEAVLQSIAEQNNGTYRYLRGVDLE